MKRLSPNIDEDDEIENEDMNMHHTENIVAVLTDATRRFLFRRHRNTWFRIGVVMFTNFNTVFGSQKKNRFGIEDPHHASVYDQDFQAMTACSAISMYCRESIGTRKLLGYTAPPRFDASNPQYQGFQYEGHTGESYALPDEIQNWFVRIVKAFRKNLFTKIYIRCLGTIRNGSQPVYGRDMTPCAGEDVAWTIMTGHDLQGLGPKDVAKERYLYQGEDPKLYLAFMREIDAGRTELLYIAGEKGTDGTMKDYLCYYVAGIQRAEYRFESDFQFMVRVE